jgi:hypothetical protein
MRGAQQIIQSRALTSAPKRRFSDGFLGCMAGSLAYAMMLRKHIAAEVSFGDDGSSPPMSRRPANSTPEGTSCAFPHRSSISIVSSSCLISALLLRPSARIASWRHPREPLPMAKRLRPMNAAPPERKPATEGISGLIERIRFHGDERVLGPAGEVAGLHQSRLFVTSIDQFHVPEMWDHSRWNCDVWPDKRRKKARLSARSHLIPREIRVGVAIYRGGL